METTESDKRRGGEGGLNRQQGLKTSECGRFSNVPLPLVYLSFHLLLVLPSVHNFLHIDCDQTLEVLRYPGTRKFYQGTGEVGLVG